MDFIRDLWASVVASSRDRTTNPLTVAFVFSWVLWNYKFFVVLLGDGATWEKLDTIALMYPQQPSTFCGAALLYPLLSALVYVFIYPVVSLIPIKVYRTYQIWTSNLIKKVERARVLSQQDAAELTRLHEREIAVLEGKVAALQVQVKSLRAALETAEAQVEEHLAARADQERLEVEGNAPHAPNLDSPPPVITGKSEEEEEEEEEEDSAPETSSQRIAQLSPPERAVLIALSNYQSTASLNDVVQSTGFNVTLTSAELESLNRKGLVLKDLDAPRDSPWRLTTEGRDMVLEHLRRSAGRGRRR